MIYRKSVSERIFDVINYLIMLLLVIVTLYPCYYVVVASVSDPVQIYASNGLLLWPKGFGLYSYLDVLKNTQLWIGYRNTIFYVLVGGLLSVMLTTTAAFSLTRRVLPGKNIILFIIMSTMYFSGGLIPTYLVVKGLHLTDTMFAVILVHAVSTYNLIITISYFRSMPYELEEAAKIDGASDYTILFRILFPLAKPIIAVIAMYYMVAKWNDYFTGMVYLRERSLFPLQLILREILLENSAASQQSTVSADAAQAYADNVKYATIVVSTIPILCVYPFVQKYFIKGVMIGAVKG